MRSRWILWVLCGFLVPCLARSADSPPEWIAEGPYVDDDSIFIELPAEIVATKIYVPVEVGGKVRRFVFDTGSPSMMSTELAAELQLEPVAKTTGRDAHGELIETSIVQSDLTVGGITFKKVPVFVADFPPIAQCLFDGVLGSELLPLCAWQIDSEESTLRCSSDLQRLDHIGHASKQLLYDFGYPHTPIVDVRFAEQATSKAMFDTGSPEYFAISLADFEGARRHGGVRKTLVGTGSPGGSLGGMAQVGQQLLVQLETLGIGTLSFARVQAMRRELSPSLLGASVLDHYVITLDMAGNAIYFDTYLPGPFARPSYGFSPSFDEGVSVALVWDNSPAQAAGLKVGDRLTSIDGQPVDSSCEGIDTVLRTLSGRQPVKLQWDGGTATLKPERLLR